MEYIQFFQSYTQLELLVEFYHNIYILFYPFPSWEARGSHLKY